MTSMHVVLVTVLQKVYNFDSKLPLSFFDPSGLNDSNRITLCGFTSSCMHDLIRDCL